MFMYNKIYNRNKNMSLIQSIRNREIGVYGYNEKYNHKIRQLSEKNIDNNRNLRRKVNHYSDSQLLKLPDENFCITCQYLNLKDISTLVHSSHELAERCTTFMGSVMRPSLLLSEAPNFVEASTRKAKRECIDYVFNEFSKFLCLPEKGATELKGNLLKLAYNICVGRLKHFNLFETKNRWEYFTQPRWDLSQSELRVKLLIELCEGWDIRLSCRVFEEATIYLQCQCLYLSPDQASMLYNVVSAFALQKRNGQLKWRSDQVAEFVSWYTYGWNTREISNVVMQILSDSRWEEDDFACFLDHLRKNPKFIWADADRLHLLLYNMRSNMDLVKRCISSYIKQVLRWNRDLTCEFFSDLMDCFGKSSLVMNVVHEEIIVLKQPEKDDALRRLLLCVVVKDGICSMLAAFHRLKDLFPFSSENSTPELLIKFLGYENNEDHCKEIMENFVLEKE